LAYNIYIPSSNHYVNLYFLLTRALYPANIILLITEITMNKPDYVAYVVAEPVVGQRARWHEVGAVWHHKNGNGFDVVLYEQLSVSGRIVCIPRGDEDDQP
jgi:hypothetical protein